MWDFDKYKNKVAVISDKGQVISYGELNNRIRKIKACICDRALVAIVCTNTVPCLVFYLSCIENGMVPLMIPESVLQEHLKKYIIVIYQMEKKLEFWILMSVSCKTRAMCC